MATAVTANAIKKERPPETKASTLHALYSGSFEPAQAPNLGRFFYWIIQLSQIAVLALAVILSEAKDLC